MGNVKIEIVPNAIIQIERTQAKIGRAIKKLDNIRNPQLIGVGSIVMPALKPCRPSTMT